MPTNTPERKCCKKCHGYYIEPKHEYWPLCNNKSCECHKIETMKPSAENNSWEKEFDEAVKKQNNEGSPYWPDWDSVKSFISTTIEKSLEEQRGRFEKILGEHNNRILNEFQLQGKSDMPFIAYDERVCLVPAMTIATKETLQIIQNMK